MGDVGRAKSHAEAAVGLFQPLAIRLRTCRPREVARQQAAGERGVRQQQGFPLVPPPLTTSGSGLFHLDIVFACQ